MKKKIHFIGIAGISMSGIAKILLEKGYQISGSDLTDSHLLTELNKQGAKISIGHSVNNVKDAEMVVVSNAIPASNVELVYTKSKGLPILKRAEVIAELMLDKKGIAIAGTHGKTTTTSMVAHLLKQGELDPLILLGGELDAIGGNAYLGTGDYLVTEADESDGSFLCFKPEIAIITNMELDHHDYYQSQNHLKATFNEFVNNVSLEGKIIAWAEDRELMEILNNDPRTFTYGLQKGILQARDIQLLPFGSYYTLVYNQQQLGEINLKVPGEYNILNSLAAIATALVVGLSFSQIKTIIEEYSAVYRRFEKKGLIGDILVVDDYAHHPTEIKATLKAAQKTGYERIVAVFQAHRYSRTKHLWQEFIHAFDLVDHLIITDIYGAGEKAIKGVNAEKLADLISKQGIKVDYIANLKDVVPYLQKIMKKRDLIITLGAGDVNQVGELLLEETKNREMV